MRVIGERGGVSLPVQLPLDRGADAAPLACLVFGSARSKPPRRLSSRKPRTPPSSVPTCRGELWAGFVFVEDAFEVNGVHDFGDCGEMYVSLLCLRDCC